MLGAIENTAEYGPSELQPYPDKIGHMGGRALSPKENDAYTPMVSGTDQKCVRNSKR